MESDSEDAAEAVIVVVAVSISAPLLFPHDVRKHTHPAVDQIVGAEAGGKPRLVIVLLAGIVGVGIAVLLIAPLDVRGEVQAVAQREVGDATAKGVHLDSLTDVALGRLIET